MQYNRPGRQTGANIGLAGFEACSLQKASTSLEVKWDFSASVNEYRVAGMQTLAAGCSSSRSVTSKAETNVSCYTTWYFQGSNETVTVIYVDWNLLIYPNRQKGVLSFLPVHGFQYLFIYS